MANRTPVLLGIGAALLVGAGAWIATDVLAEPDPIMDVLSICETVPDKATADTSMASLGWDPMPDALYDDMNKSAALFFVALRRSSMDDFDFDAEQSLFDQRLADNAAKLGNYEAQAYVAPDGIGFAQIEWIVDLPNTVACDVMLPAPANTDAFADVIRDGEAQGDRRAWSQSLMSMDQRPRPGLWVASLVEIDGDPDLTTFFGGPVIRTVFATAAYRGEISQ
ncbi:hypothetical protein [Yoonia sp. 208BN28-4]|uniref:hypothetical protein n=1 Tax=Yoonia sp. 208BN28-4 TaxID=3126505 RepID=UPI0030B23328